MDLKQLIMLAFQVSIMSTVFGFGLGATSDDLLYLVRRPRLLLRSFLAMFVIVPRARVGDGTLLAMAVFAVVGLAVGHVMAGPDREHQVVLALASACRHPGIALTIAAVNYPDQRFGAVILLYLIVSAAVCLPYIAWQRQRAAVPA